MEFVNINCPKYQRIQELSLIIHNARIYGVEVKSEWLEEYGKLYEEVLGEKWKIVSRSQNKYDRI